MKFILKTLFLFAINLPAIGAEPANEFKSLLNSLESSAQANSGLNFSKLEKVWSTLPDSKKGILWPEMALAYIDQSERALASNEPAKAAVFLAAAEKLNRLQGGRIEYSTKSPTAFFKRLAKLQVGIASRTGNDPLQGTESYLFRKIDDEYLVARHELEPEVNGVTIDGISSSDVLIQALYLSVDDGKVGIRNTRWLIGPKGKIEDSLDHAIREIHQDEHGRFVPQQIPKNRP